MEFDPSKAAKRPPASSTNILSGAKSQGLALGSIQTSARPCATSMASIAPPSPRTDQKRSTQLKSPAIRVTPFLLKPLKQRTASWGEVISETLSRVPSCQAPPPLLAESKNC